MHLHFHHAVALAGFTPPTAAARWDIETKPPGAVAALARRWHLDHQFANRGKEAGVGRGVGAWRATNRRLVHINHLVEMLNAFNRFMGCGFVLGAVDGSRGSGV